MGVVAVSAGCVAVLLLICEAFEKFLGLRYEVCACVCWIGLRIVARNR